MGQPVQPTAPAPPTTQKPFKVRLQELLGEMAIEAVTTFALIAIIAGGRHFVEWSIGSQGKFFDYIPVAWVFDVGDILLIARLLWRALKRFND